jgi:hypothetical protein
MAGANGATPPAAEDAPEAPPETPSGTVEGSAGPEAGATARKNRRRSPAAKTSAAGKARTKKAKPATQEELAMVGEVIQIAHNGGKASMPAQELVDIWRARVDAWDKAHGVV